MYSTSLTSFNLGRHTVNILKMCMWGSDRHRIILTGLQLSHLSTVCNAGCVFYVTTSLTVLVDVSKTLIHTVDILKMCMLGSDRARNYLDRITVF